MLCFLKWEITFILNFHSLNCLLVLCAYHWVIFTVCVFVLCWVQPPLPSYPSPPTSWHNKVLCFYELTFLVVIMNGYHFSSKRTLFERTSFFLEILPEQLCGSVFLNIPIFFILFLQGWTSFSVFLRWWRWFQAHVLFTHGTLSSAGRNANDSHTASAENSL